MCRYSAYSIDLLVFFLSYSVVGRLGGGLTAADLQRAMMNISGMMPQPRQPVRTGRRVPSVRRALTRSVAMNRVEAHRSLCVHTYACKYVRMYVALCTKVYVCVYVTSTYI